MGPTRKAKIIAALESKGATKPCSRCGGLKFEILGESNASLNSLDTFNALSAFLAPSQIPIIYVACPNCGHVWHHAISKLGVGAI